MVSIQLDIVGAITGIIGTVTGVASLVWHILESRPKLILESAYFKKGGFGITEPRGRTLIGVKLNLRNKGKRSVTIEDIYIAIGCESPQIHFHPVTIDASSSKFLTYELMFTDKNFKRLFNGSQTNFIVSINHTFGKIIKKGKSNFWTGHFTLE